MVHKILKSILYLIICVILWVIGGVFAGLILLFFPHCPHEWYKVTAIIFGFIFLGLATSVIIEGWKGS